MLAVDTNVVVRYLTGDHSEQSERARAIIDGHDILIGTTVLLETEWVLRRAYGYSSALLASALRGLAGHPRVDLEEPGRTAQALDWMDAGLDFADALHLSGAQACEAFVSFDQTLARRAARVGGIAVRAP